MSRFRMTLVALLAALAAAAPAQAAPEDFGLKTVGATLSSYQAGAHPDFTTTFEMKQDPASKPNFSGLRDPYAHLRDTVVELPPGLTGNPSVIPASQQCSALEFSKVTAAECPSGGQVGMAHVQAWESDPLNGVATIDITVPVFLMAPPAGDVVARLGFAPAIAVMVDLRARPEDDYAISATVLDAEPKYRVVRVELTTWGVPADPVHDTERPTTNEAFNGTIVSPPRPPGGPPLAFLVNPTSCGYGRQVVFSVKSWLRPDLPSTMAAPLQPFTGCDLLEFDPQIDLQPTTSRAESPSGMDVELSLPQDAISDPGGFAEAHLKKAVVTLPEGMSLNPAAADGLEGCSTGAIGLISKSPIRFDSSDPTCPKGSKVGTAQIVTPLLPDPIEGALYLADQDDNPFDTLLSGYLVAQGQGVVLKLAGRFDTDPGSGRITATFDGNPQQPFDTVKLHFKSGSRGVLITPSRCGTYEIHSRLTSWAAGDPDNPTPAETVERTSSFTIDRGPDGGPCPSGALDPHLAAGTTIPIAGVHSPFFLRLSREDASGIFTALDVTTPEGITAKLKGIPYCPEAAIAAAGARGGLGLGALEIASPSCPAASQVGQISAGAGAGATPLYVSTGKAYLAGPYKGAPLSLVATIPAVAGPFDLGTVVNRIALHLDPETAQVSASSDPFPTILQGIPLDVRDIRVSLDRPQFVLNPTDCSEKAVDATVHGVGATAKASNRFQVEGCRGLGFKPKLSMRLFGKTNRGAHPRFEAILKARPGDANIERASVALPRSEFLDQGHIRTVCTRVQFAINQCPAGSVYGFAKATTPLLEGSLSGPVYLRSSSNKLPDLVAVLGGQISVEVVGRVDSVNGGIRNTFEVVPDAPVDTFTLSMQGGKKGLLINSRNLCAAPARATAEFRAQNGRAITLRPQLRNACKGHKRK